MATDTELVAAYRRQFDAGGEGEDFWAWEDVLELCHSLEKGLAITLKLIASADDELYLAYVAAGPLEDILKWHGSAAIPALEGAAAESDNVRRALASVWLSPQAEGYSEWERLMKTFGLLSQKKHAPTRALTSRSSGTRRKRRAP
jgi:hypothetical protein